MRRSARLRSRGPAPAEAAAPARKRPRAGASRASPGPKKKAKAKATKAKATKAKAGPTREHERRRWGEGRRRVAGVDEAGRGPLAGPVVAAAVGVPEGVAEGAGVADSKAVATAAERERLFAALEAEAQVQVAWAVVDRAEIDRINILQAAMKAMEEAVGRLDPPPDFVLVDGPRVPAGLDAATSEAVVKGDAKSYAIAAASIVAKVVRDRIMVDMDKKYPEYGFGQHKGYGVPAHLRALEKHGPCPIHRRTFAPVKHMVAAD